MHRNYVPFFRKVRDLILIRIFSIIFVELLSSKVCKKVSVISFSMLRICLMFVALNENTNLQQLYVKQLTSLKQSLTNMNHLSMGVASIYSKVLLFLSSLYSIKAETMQTLFCQHLLHNPMYSYLITS